jgi:aminopeptidase N
MWNDFGHGRDDAFELDALSATHPVYSVVRTADEATENFDAITYEKGAAVIRMLERYLGSAVFRRGVRRYIRRHREANARAADLWAALAEAAGESVHTVVRPWIERAGFPLVRLAAGEDARSLELTQEPFVAGPNKPKGKSATWPVPLVLRTRGRGGRREVRHLLTARRARLALPPGAGLLYGNADEGGFYRPLHDARLQTTLLAAFPRLRATERMGVISHQWAAVAAGYADAGSFIAVVRACARERDPEVLGALAGPLGFLIHDLADAAGGGLPDALRALVREVFAPALAELGLKVERGESQDARLRRSWLTHLLAVLAQDDATVAALQAACERYLERPSAVEANLAMVAVTVGAVTGDRQRHRRYVSGSQAAATPQQQRRLRMALADFRAPELIDASLRLCLQPVIPTQDKALLLARLMGNPHSADATWDFVKRSWNKLEQLLTPMLVSRLIDATPALRSPAHRRDVAHFFADHPVPTAARALKLADERFRNNTALRERAAPQLQRALLNRL